MTRVLVTGGTGIVGRFLLPRLLAEGMEAHALSRRPQPPDAIHWHAADVTSERWSRGLPRVDLMIHAAPLWLLPPLLPALRRLGVARLIAFGSTSRHTKVDSPSPGERAVAEALMRAEADLAAQGGFLTWTVFRPTLIYGAGLDQNVSAIARFIQRFGFFPVAGSAAGRRQPVHAGDLAEACLQAFRAPVTFGQCFDLGGGETIGYREMVGRIFAALERRPRIVSVPIPALRAAAGLAAYLPGLRSLDPAMIDRMNQDLVFDLAPARDAFGYAPRPFQPQRDDLGRRA